MTMTSSSAEAGLDSHEKVMTLMADIKKSANTDGGEHTIGNHPKNLRVTTRPVNDGGRNRNNRS